MNLSALTGTVLRWCYCGVVQRVALSARQVRARAVLGWQPEKLPALPVLLLPGPCRQGSFEVSKAAGISNRMKRLAEIKAEVEKDMAPGKFGCVQVRELWSTSEERHYRPGHHWKSRSQ